MFSQFPMCIKGYLYMNDGSINDGSSISWQKKYCVLLENDSKLYIFDDEFMEESLQIPKHLTHFRLDKDFQGTGLYNSCNFIDGESTTSSKNLDSDRYASNLSLNQGGSSKHSKNFLFRNGSRFFFRTKSSSKLNNYGKEGVPENSSGNQTKSVSSLKRSQSLNRVARKKSEDQQRSKSPMEQMRNNGLLTMSTGDLTVDQSKETSQKTHQSHRSSGRKPGSAGKLSLSSPPPSSSTNTIKVLSLSATQTFISDVHPSLVDDRPFSFCVLTVTSVHRKPVFHDQTTDSVPSQMSVSNSNLSNISSSTQTSTNVNISNLFTSQNSHIFAARSLLEKQCWIKRLQQTTKPNWENENRFSNSLKLTISECKGVGSQKRKYFCTISFDKAYFGRSTSKLSSDDGILFWGEDFSFDNLFSFKNLTISLYKEPDSNKEGKKKKKKSPQCVGQCQFNLSQLSSKSELQNWYHLRSQDLLQTESSIQMRLRIKYESLKVLTKNAYHDLYQMTTINYLELINFLEKVLPIKHKEEMARCLVNIHENNGTIIEFLNNLIVEEISDTENTSMFLRANTIITKIIECYIRLIGNDYLYSMFHILVHDVMRPSENDEYGIEVDPQKINETSSIDKQKRILDNQLKLLNFVKQTWNRIFESRYSDFPKQLKLVFYRWRVRFLEKAKKECNKSKIEEINEHCDLIISGCIFLRLLCPAILSPHLFGLISHFSENDRVRRTLTLIAKSLQSLANFSKFGDKEEYMVFMNKYFDEEIPRMHHFLRSISTLDPHIDDSDEDNVELEKTLEAEVQREIVYCGAVVDCPVELARLHNLLTVESIKESITKSPKIHKAVFQLPQCLNEISQKLISFSITPINSAIVTSKSVMTSSAISSAVTTALGGVSSNNISDFKKFGSNLNNQMNGADLKNQPRRKSSCKELIPPQNLQLISNSSISPKTHELFSEFSQNKKIEPVDDYGNPIIDQSPSFTDKSDVLEEDVWQLRRELVNDPSNNKKKYIRPQQSTVSNNPLPVSYSNKSQYRFAPVTRTPNSMTTHKAHYHTQEDTSNVTTSYKQSTSTKTNKSQRPQVYGGSARQPPRKSPISSIKSSPGRSSDHFINQQYTKVQDTPISSYIPQPAPRSNRLNRPSSHFDPSCYQENSLYGIVDSNVPSQHQSPLSSASFSRKHTSNEESDPIEEYFVARNRLKNFEEEIRNAESTNYDVDNLNQMCQDVELMKLKVQDQQIKDLEKLKSYVAESRGMTAADLTCTTRTASGTVNKRSHHHHHHHRPSYDSTGPCMMSTSDELDEVINRINLDEAGLEETQQSMRRRHQPKQPPVSSHNPSVSSHSTSQLPGSITSNISFSTYTPSPNRLPPYNRSNNSNSDNSSIL